MRGVIRVKIVIDFVIRVMLSFYLGLNMEMHFYMHESGENVS